MRFASDSCCCRAPRTGAFLSLPTDHPLSADLRLGEGGFRRTPKWLCVWGGQSVSRALGPRLSPETGGVAGDLLAIFPSLPTQTQRHIYAETAQVQKCNTKHRLEPSD